MRPDYAPIIGDFLARRVEEKDIVLFEKFQVPNSQLGQTHTLVINEGAFELHDAEGDQVLNGKVGSLAQQGD